MDIHKKNPTSSPHVAKARWFGWGALLALSIWISTDLYVPRKHSIRQFDPSEVARLETDMWQSYYAKNPALLFWQLAAGLRQQFHASFWRSFVLAFQATKAAFVFKRGTSRPDYQQTLPGLVSYYRAIQELTVESFDVPKVAQLELEWWIVHRQRDRYSYSDLADALVQTSAALYRQPPTDFIPYGKLRADAMRRCDEAGQKSGGASKADWERIEVVLTQAWSDLQLTVQKSPKHQLAYAAAARPASAADEPAQRIYPR